MMIRKASIGLLQRVDLQGLPWGISGGGVPDPYADYLVYDSYTDDDAVTLPNHVLDKDTVGGGWIALLSNGNNPWKISGNEAVDPGAGASDQYTVIDCGVADFILELTAIVDLVSGWLLWTVFRNDGVNTNKSWFFMYHGGASQWRLYKFDGVYVVMDSQAEAAPVGTITIKIVCDGNDIECYVNDVLKCNITHAFNNDKSFLGPGSNTPRDDYGSLDNFSVVAV